VDIIVRDGNCQIKSVPITSEKSQRTITKEMGRQTDNGSDKEKEWERDEEDIKILNQKLSEKINYFSNFLCDMHN
jgi:hypothetical protein